MLDGGETSPQGSAGRVLAGTSRKIDMRYQIRPGAGWQVEKIWIVKKIRRKV
jgi:hypothetical protein